uniref:Uncharacterized protein n=1 Tax=Tetraselmis sp. GSL018 TaxID=582737 RepID=A0A061RFR8_9CHLO
MLEALTRASGAEFVSVLHTERWRPAFSSQAQLDSVARVSPMGAFQYLFELSARGLAPLLQDCWPACPGRLSGGGGAPAIRWQASLHGLRLWIERHAHRVLGGTVQLFLHNILASAVIEKPHPEKPPEYDPHAFLLHVIKICSSQGVETFFRRLKHPTGPRWLWDGYAARMKVYKATYHELNLERFHGDGKLDFKQVPMPEAKESREELQDQLQVQTQNIPETLSGILGQIRRRKSNMSTRFIRKWKASSRQLAAVATLGGNGRSGPPPERDQSESTETDGCSNQQANSVESSQEDFLPAVGPQRPRPGSAGRTKNSFSASVELYRHRRSNPIGKHIRDAVFALQESEEMQNAMKGDRDSIINWWNPHPQGHA